MLPNHPRTNNPCLIQTVPETRKQGNNSQLFYEDHKPDPKTRKGQCKKGKKKKERKLKAIRLLSVHQNCSLLF